MHRTSNQPPTRAQDGLVTTAPGKFWLSSLTGVAVVGLCTGGVLLGTPAGDASAATPSVQSDTGSAGVSDSAGTGGEAGSPSSASPGSVYHDGEYSATGFYLTPGGDETIGVTLVVAHGLVTDTAVRAEAMSPTAHQFQVQFQSDIRTTVVGRDLAGLSVNRVAGASLTSVGFNDALTKIRDEATA